MTTLPPASTVMPWLCSANPPMCAHRRYLNSVAERVCPSLQTQTGAACTAAALLHCVSAGSHLPCRTTAPLTPEATDLLQKHCQAVPAAAAAVRCWVCVTAAARARLTPCTHALTSAGSTGLRDHAAAAGGCLGTAALPCLEAQAALPKPGPLRELPVSCRQAVRGARCSTAPRVLQQCLLETPLHPPCWVRCYGQWRSRSLQPLIQA